MALFGRNKTADINDIENINNDKYELDREERNQLLEILDEKSSKIKAIKGSSGKGESPLFLEKSNYKFIEQDDKYFFYRRVDSSDFRYGSGAIEDIRNAIDEKPIILEKKDYSCILLRHDLIEKVSQNAIAECVMHASEIKVKFENVSGTGETFTFSFINRPENISPMSAFFSKIGVRNYYNIVNIPEETFKITINKGDGFLSDATTYVAFRNGNIFTLLRSSKATFTPQITIAEIHASEILYYKQEGSLRYEQSVSGGGGASTSYAGAFIGGLLFGAAGAIIGSRANEKPVNVSSTTITHDDRVLVLCIKRENVVYQISVDLEAEEILDWIIPEKQYDYVISRRRQYFESLIDA